MPHNDDHRTYDHHVHVDHNDDVCTHEHDDHPRHHHDNNGSVIYLDLTRTDGLYRPIPRGSQPSALIGDAGYDITLRTHRST